jgi:hypothetical protein
MAANNSTKYSHVSNISVGGDTAGGKLLFPSRDGGVGVVLGPEATADNGYHDILGQIQDTPGGNPTSPNWTQISTSALYAWQFAVADEVWIHFHVPHDYVKGTDIYIHAHWIPDGTNINPVKWQWEFAYANGHNQAAFPIASTTTVTAEQTPVGTAFQHYITETTAITIAGMEPDGIIMCHMSRITNGATDNTDGIFLLMSDIHYQSSGLPTKNKAPDFYV